MAECWKQSSFQRSETKYSTLQVGWLLKNPTLLSASHIYQVMKLTEAEISRRSGRLNLKFKGTKVFLFKNFFPLSVCSARRQTPRQLCYLGTQQAGLIGQNSRQLLQSRPQELASLSVHGPSAGRTSGGGGSQLAASKHTRITIKRLF